MREEYNRVLSTPTEADSILADTNILAKPKFQSISKYDT